jgi:integrase
MRRRLTDKGLHSLPVGTHIDTEVSGFGVRVSPRGKRTFILINRYGGSNPTRRSLGTYPDITLSEARDKAREWRKLIADGVDPKAEHERRKRERQRRGANTFAVVAEAFLDHIKDRRRADDTTRIIRRVFVTKWGDRPITDIERFEVREAIESTAKRGKVSMAHSELGALRRLFNFAISREKYGLEHSPCDRINPTQLIGERKHRDRILNDAELAALWRAAEAMGYPWGSAVRMLMLTGQRRSEVAEAQWSEFDLDKRLWTIPQRRFKSAAPHVVPLTNDALALLDALPRFKRGDFVFSYNYGASPMSISAPLKDRLDAAVSAELGHQIEAYVIHDIRRTVRSSLPRLRVPTEISELVIGHTKRGLHKVYDQYAYLDEKRDALSLWNGYLRGVIKPSKVVKLRG